MEKTQIKENLSEDDLKEIKKIKSLPGDVIGAAFTEDINFILKKEGKEGLEKIEEFFEKVCLIKYQEIANFKWYPLSYYIIFLFLVKRIFNWDDKTIKEMGANAIKISSITRMMMRYFISARRCLKESPFYWKKYFTAGSLGFSDYNEEKRYLLMIIKDFPGHQVWCCYFEGVLETIGSFMFHHPQSQEIECGLKKGNNTHVFKVTWESK